jgi:hypothetical protein
MSFGSRLDGAVMRDTDSPQDIALAALTRRVAELEHRLNVMKIIVGLVLAAKVLLVVLILYVLLGHGLFRSAGPNRATSQAAAWVTLGWWPHRG